MPPATTEPKATGCYKLGLHTALMTERVCIASVLLPDPFVSWPTKAAKISQKGLCGIAGKLARALTPHLQAFPEPQVHHVPALKQSSMGVCRKT